MISAPRVAAATALAMASFAGNSLLCRLALKSTSIDAATFTTVRLASGAIVLALLAGRARRGRRGGGSWGSALALFAYAAAFSFAYRSLTAATGALLLFVAVQITMIGVALATGERPGRRQLLGMATALAGLVGLLLPGLSAPSPRDSALMLVAGVAWGIYSLRGRRTTDPLGATGGNFLRAVPFAVASSLATLGGLSWDSSGVLYAAASGAITSGIGYALWYEALPSLTATNAAVVQLCVPVLAALGGIALLGEPWTLRFVLASAATLGGIAVATLKRGAVS